jgi:hypothetical protein
MGEVAPHCREAHGVDLEANRRMRLVDAPALSRQRRASATQKR